MAKTDYFWPIFVLTTGTQINEGPLYKYMGFVFGLKATPSPKQPFSFLGQLAINSARHAKQLFSSVPAGV